VLSRLTPAAHRQLYGIPLLARGLPPSFGACQFFSSSSLELQAFVVACLGGAISRTAVVAHAAAGGVASIAPTAGRNRPAMSAAKPLVRRGYFETQHAPLGAIARPPPAAQNRQPVALTTPFVRRRHFLRAITFRAAGIAMTSAPVTRTNRSAMNFAELVRARASAPSDCFLFGAHDAKHKPSYGSETMGGPPISIFAP